MRHLKAAFSRLKKSQSGQAIVELALTLPLVLTLICGILELGWVCSNKLAIDNVCREGVRYGITYSADGLNAQMVEDRVAELAPPNLRDGLDVTVVYSNPTEPRSGDLTVTVGYDLETITPLIGIFSGNSIHLESTCEMKMG
ncbi:MAG TPA: pilus assembly protein [Oscillospiraceae bacterium]|nr:pilus assembly protein [Oscillospiraceae bacterium]